MPTKLPAGYWRVMSHLLITMHSLCDTYTEYGYYRKHCYCWYLWICV